MTRLGALLIPIFLGCARADAGPTLEPSPPAMLDAAPSKASATVDPIKPPEGKRFLIIGDSHLFGGLAPALKKALSSGGQDRVWIYASCGSSPPTFIHGIPSPCGTMEDVPGRPLKRVMKESRIPAINEVLTEASPHMTLIVMGSNFMTGAKHLSDSIKELLDSIKRVGSRCAWLGPPIIPTPGEPLDDAHIRRFYREIAREIGDRCALIDSRQVYVRGTGDDMHVEPESATTWGEWAASLVLASMRSPSSEAL